MTSFHTHIRLPIGPLGGSPLLLLAEPVSDADFVLRQRDFIQQVFGHCTYLRNCARTTPVSDAFLSVLVNLIDVLDANAPDDACRCVQQLVKVLQTVSPQLLGAPSSGGDKKGSG